MAITPTLKKTKRSQIHHPHFYPKKPEQEKQKTHTGRKKEIIKTIAEIMN